MSEVKQLLKSLEENGGALSSPYIMAEALERNVKEIVQEYLANSRYCMRREEENDSWQIPGNRLMTIKIEHPLLSMPLITSTTSKPEGVEVTITVARMEKLLKTIHEKVMVHNVEEALRLITNIVFGIDPPNDSEQSETQLLSDQ